MYHSITSFARDFLWFYRKKIIPIAIGITLISLIGVGLLLARGNNTKETVTQESSMSPAATSQYSSLLRIHVIANSDSQSDQSLKLQIRDVLLKEMETWLSSADTLEETVEQVQNHMEELEVLAEREIARAGYVYPVQAELVNCYFTERMYGNVAVPEGIYPALRILIGEAAGQNWWGILFPKLCFYDAIHPVPTEEQEEVLWEVLGEEKYDSLFDWKRSDLKIKSYLFDY